NLAIALAYFKAFGKSIWLFGIIAFCLSAVMILMDVTTLERLGLFMSVNIILILYAAEINLLLVTPYIACIRQAQAKIL
ncbi:MAG: hypothetical protein LBV04_07365, partial [Deferribacteraceae bacterium]|nr:hypothetical protein [Deferribacteraceae bacterium]